MGVELDLYGLRRTVLTTFPLAIAGAVLSAAALSQAWLMDQLITDVGGSTAFLAYTLFLTWHFPSERFAYGHGRPGAAVHRPARCWRGWCSTMAVVAHAMRCWRFVTYPGPVPVDLRNLLDRRRLLLDFLRRRHSGAGSSTLLRRELGWRHLPEVAVRPDLVAVGPPACDLGARLLRLWNQ